MSNNYIYNHSKKTIILKILNYFFTIEPKNTENLLLLIKKLEESNNIEKNILNMLKGVITISKKRICEIMIPRLKIVFLKTTYTIKKCLDIIIKTAHSRFPVISEDNNSIEGFLIAKDFLSFNKDSSDNSFLKKIIRPAIIVPESKYADSMLKDFQSKNYHMAIVIDEFGIISGLVTIEDILELIVGKIEDEHDSILKSEQNIQKIKENNYFVNGLTSIKEFNISFNTMFNDKEVDTIGGLLLIEFGRIPKINEKIKIRDFIFKISSVNNKRIVQIKLKKIISLSDTENKQK